MSHRPTAGQASIEYVAALALLAALFVVAAPAVGAPDIPRLVVGKLRLGICLVANDVCSAQAAKDAGLAPCPLRSDTSGVEASVTAFSIELGGRMTLTVTPQSDGSVAVVYARSGSVGVSGGVGADFSAGPVTFEVGASGTARVRVQRARGWHFPDEAAARPFLEHARRHAVVPVGWPPTWISLEGGGELAGMVGLELRGSRFADRGGLAGLAGGGQVTDGGRVSNDGLVTLYTRAAVDGPELSFPFLPGIGRGRNEWLVEYTFGRDGPREIAFRTATPGGLGNRITETAYRLDLRDPANYAATRPFLLASVPWPPDVVDKAKAVLDRIQSHGVIERVVSDIEDDSVGASGSVRGGWKFGAGGKRIRMHKQLVDATARTGGTERDRFDCVTA